MALSFSRVDETVHGNERVTIFDITFDSSYPSGGEAVAASDVGLTKINRGEIDIKTVGGTVNVANANFDRTNSKIVVYDETPGEVAGSATLATLVVQGTFYGF